MNTHSSTALLLMDFQAGILDRYPEATQLIEKANLAAETARKAGMAVIFVKVGFAPGHPEIGPRSSKNFQMAKADNRLAGDESRFVETLKVLPGDITVDKKRFSAFAGSTLDIILRANGITRLVLAGVRTAGVVLSTLRYAADEDYELTVLSDLVADPDAEIQKVLVEKVFPLQAVVITTEKWIAGL